MTQSFDEWIRQAQYDIETAQVMLTSGRYNYVLFMCHLAVEKSLKGLLHKRTGTIPIKTHNLIYLIKQLDLVIPEPTREFFVELNQMAIFSRYPTDLAKLLRDFSHDIAKETLQKSEETLAWIKEQY